MYASVEGRVYEKTRMSLDELSRDKRSTGHVGLPMKIEKKTRPTGEKGGVRNLEGGARD